MVYYFLWQDNMASWKLLYFYAVLRYLAICNSQRISTKYHNSSEHSPPLFRNAKRLNTLFWLYQAWAYYNILMFCRDTLKEFVINVTHGFNYQKAEKVFTKIISDTGPVRVSDVCQLEMPFQLNIEEAIHLR